MNHGISDTPRHAAGGVFSFFCFWVYASGSSSFSLNSVKASQSACISS